MSRLRKLLPPPPPLGHSPCRPARRSHCRPPPPAQICRQGPAEGRRGRMRAWQLPGGQGHPLPIKASAKAGLALLRVTHRWAWGRTTAEPHGMAWLCRSSPPPPPRSGSWKAVLGDTPPRTHTLSNASVASQHNRCVSVRGAQDSSEFPTRNLRSPPQGLVHLILTGLASSCPPCPSHPPRYMRRPIRLAASCGEGEQGRTVGGGGVREAGSPGAKGGACPRADATLCPGLSPKTRSAQGASSPPPSGCSPGTPSPAPPGHPEGTPRPRQPLPEGNQGGASRALSCHGILRPQFASCCFLQALLPLIRPHSCPTFFLVPGGALPKI